MKPLAYITVTLIAAGLGIGFATGRMFMPEAAFLKILWFAAATALSGIIYLTTGYSGKSGWNGEVILAKEQERLGFACLPFVIATFVYILGRAIAIAS